MPKFDPATGTWSTDQQELASLAEQAGVPQPRSGFAAAALGATPDQSKMVGTPAQKQNALAQAQKQAQQQVPPASLDQASKAKADQMAKLGQLSAFLGQNLAGQAASAQGQSTLQQTAQQTAGALNLDQATGIPSADLDSLLPNWRGMTLPQMSQAIEAERAKTLSQVESLRTRLADPQLSAAEAESLRLQLRSLGAAGVTGAEAGAAAGAAQFTAAAPGAQAAAAKAAADRLAGNKAAYTVAEQNMASNVELASQGLDPAGRQAVVDALKVSPPAFDTPPLSEFLAKLDPQAQQVLKDSVARGDTKLIAETLVPPSSTVSITGAGAGTGEIGGGAASTATLAGADTAPVDLGYSPNDPNISQYTNPDGSVNQDAVKASNELKATLIPALADLLGINTEGLLPNTDEFRKKVADGKAIEQAIGDEDTFNLLINDASAPELSTQFKQAVASGAFGTPPNPAKVKAYASSYTTNKALWKSSEAVIKSLENSATPGADGKVNPADIDPKEVNTILSSIMGPGKSLVDVNAAYARLPYLDQSNPTVKDFVSKLKALDTNSNGKIDAADFAKLREGLPKEATFLHTVLAGAIPEYQQQWEGITNLKPDIPDVTNNVTYATKVRGVTKGYSPALMESITKLVNEKGTISPADLNTLPIDWDHDSQTEKMLYEAGLLDSKASASYLKQLSLQARAAEQRKKDTVTQQAIDSAAKAAKDQEDQAAQDRANTYNTQLAALKEALDKSVGKPVYWYIKKQIEDLNTAWSGKGPLPKAPVINPTALSYKA